jgi:hypothetical protein
VRAYRLEANGEEELRRGQAAGELMDLLAELRVTERLDGADASLCHVAGHALDQHAS